MLENIYTTKMSANKKQLQNRFTKIRSSNGRISKIMSAVMAIFVAVTFVCATVVMAALNSEETKDFITLYSHGEIIELENKPFIQDDMTYFPLRETFEKLGVFKIKGNDLVWDNGTIHINVSDTADRAPVSYTIKIGSEMIDIKHSKDTRISTASDNPIMKVNLYMPNQSPLLVDEKTYVPYTFVEYMLSSGLGLRGKLNLFDFMFTINTENPSAFTSQGFVWPCDGHVSYPFGERIHPVTNQVIKHNGVDIAANEGTDVKAAIYGTVTQTGYNAEKGYFVIIERDNIQTVYSSLMQDIPVTNGDEVVRGQNIGKVGNTGTSTGAHLHFEVLIDGEYYNPELVN